MAIGTLYLVGTPIGNLEDMTARAIKTLQTVNLIAAEDTRHTGRLLQYFQIQTPMLSYHEHNAKERIPMLLAKLQNGEAIAIVTDAGMPGISDPGTELVKACVTAQIPIIPIPGVTAGITALVASGMDTNRFVFHGFLATDSSERRSQLQHLQTETSTIILYESPHRLIRTLQDLSQILTAARAVAIARELTKLYETFWRGSLGEGILHFTAHPPKGEFTLIVAGKAISSEPNYTEAQLLAELQSLIRQGIPRSQASRQLATDFGISRRQLYQLALTLPEESLHKSEI